jgi:hypothetical protein
MHLQVVARAHTDITAVLSMDVIYPEYESFQAYAEDGDYVFKDIANSDKQSAFLCVVSIYRVRAHSLTSDHRSPLCARPQGIPVSQTVDTAIDDGERYLYLGAKFDKYFMRKQDFEDRFDEISDSEVLKADFDLLKNKNTNLFPIWTSRGKPVSLQRTLYAQYRSGMTFQEWAGAQREGWKRVIISVGEETTTVPYNVFSRFIQPDPVPSGFELVFSTIEKVGHVTKEELETYVEEAMSAANAPKYKWRVLTYQEAKADTRIVPLSSSFFPFYHTWITPENYQKICPKHLDRPWPADAAVAASVDGLLKRDGLPQDGLQTETLISAHKMRAAHGKRVTVPSQKAVMGNSATEVRIAREFSWANVKSYAIAGRQGSLAAEYARLREASC